MRPNRILSGIVVFLALASASAAQDGIDRLLRERNVKLLSKDVVSGRNSYAFVAPGNVQFRVESSVDLSEQTLNTVFRLWDNIFSWKSLTPGSQNFRVAGDAVTLRLVPGSFIADGRDLAPFVPSGLSFTLLSDRVEYDFRLKSGAYFIRLAGRLQNETVFLERFRRAVDDPAAFARENDPDYVSRRIVELQEALEAADEAQKAAGEAQKAADAKTIALEERVKTLEESLSALIASVGERENTVDARFAAAEKLEAENAQRDAIERQALIDLFVKAKPKPVAVELVEKVRSMKASQPSLTGAEIAAALKAEGTSTSEKIVNAILTVFFGR